MNPSEEGHVKNARNHLQSLVVEKRHGREPSEEDLQYCLDEIKASLEGGN